jgi:hypothetical protein
MTLSTQQLRPEVSSCDWIFDLFAVLYDWVALNLPAPRDDDSVGDFESGMLVVAARDLINEIVRGDGSIPSTLLDYLQVPGKDADLVERPFLMRSFCVLKCIDQAAADINYFVPGETPVQGLTIGSSADVQAVDGTAPTGSVHLPPTLTPSFYAQFSRRKVYLAGEYDRIPINATLTIESTVIPFVEDGRSWFAMGSYRLSKNVQVGSYYSHYVNKAADTTQPANHSKDFVVSGRYDFNPYFYAKIEGHFLHGTALGYYSDTNPNGLAPDSKMLSAKIGFTF